MCVKINDHHPSPNRMQSLSLMEITNNNNLATTLSTPISSSSLSLFMRGCCNIWNDPLRICGKGLVLQNEALTHIAALHAQNNNSPANKTKIFVTGDGMSKEGRKGASIRMNARRHRHLMTGIACTNRSHVLHKNFNAERPRVGVFTEDARSRLEPLSKAKKQNKPSAPPTIPSFQYNKLHYSLH